MTLLRSLLKLLETFVRFMGHFLIQRCRRLWQVSICSPLNLVDVNIKSKLGNDNAFRFNLVLDYFYIQ